MPVQHFLQQLVPHISDFLLIAKLFCTCCLYGSFQFLMLQAFLTENFCQTFCQAFIMVQRQEWMHKLNIGRPQLFHIGVDTFGIGCYDRAVIAVISFLTFFFIVRNTGIENLFDPFYQQIMDMSMHQLGRITE